MDIIMISHILVCGQSLKSKSMEKWQNSPTAKKSKNNKVVFNMLSSFYVVCIQQWHACLTHLLLSGRSALLFTHKAPGTVIIKTSILLQYFTTFYHTS